MTCLKSILFAAAVLIAVASIEAVPVGMTSNDYYECPDKSLAEEKLMDFTLHQPGEARNALSKDINFPNNGNVNGRKITCIQIFDLKTDGTGGFATITNGGLDAYDISINLKSQVNQGLEFRIILWTTIATTHQPKISHEK